SELRRIPARVDLLLQTTGRIVFFLNRIIERVLNPGDAIQGIESEGCALALCVSDLCPVAVSVVNVTDRISERIHDGQQTPFVVVGVGSYVAPFVPRAYSSIQLIVGVLDKVAFCIGLFNQQIVLVIGVIRGVGAGVAHAEAIVVRIIGVRGYVVERVGNGQ